MDSKTDKTPRTGINAPCLSDGEERVARYVTLERAYDRSSFKWIVCHLGIFGEPVDPAKAPDDEVLD